jgi:hypothetical protein
MIHPAIDAVLKYGRKWPAFSFRLWPLSMSCNGPVQLKKGRGMSFERLLELGNTDVPDCRCRMQMAVLSPASQSAAIPIFIPLRQCWSYAGNWVMTV